MILRDKDPELGLRWGVLLLIKACCCSVRGQRFLYLNSILHIELEKSRRAKSQNNVNKSGMVPLDLLCRRFLHASSQRQGKSCNLELPNGYPSLPSLA